MTAKRFRFHCGFVYGSNDRYKATKGIADHGIIAQNHSAPRCGVRARYEGAKCMAEICVRY